MRTVIAENCRFVPRMKYTGEWTGNFSAFTMRMHCFTFCMRIYAYFGGRSNTLGISFVLGVNQTLKRNLPQFIGRDHENELKACIKQVEAS